MEQKILVYGMSNNRGGMEAYFITYYEEIKKQNLPIQFDFVTDYTEIAYQNIIEKYGDKIYFIPSRRENLIKHFCDLRRIIKKNSYTKVYFNVLSASTVFTIAAAYRIKKCKIVVHSHNDSVKAMRRHIFLRPFLNMMTDIRLACSDKAGRFMFGEKYANSNQISVVKNAINPEKYTFSQSVRKSKREKLGISAKYVLGTVGRLCYQKNTLFLIDIFPMILRKIPEAVLIIVGEGDLRSEVEKQIRDLGLEDKIFLLGMRTDVPDLLQAMDVFLLPSRFEGLCIAAIEAQCIGLPVVASDQIAEETKIVPHFVRVPLEDKSKWAECVISLYKDSVERKTCIEEIVAYGFDIHEECSKLISILNMD